MHFARRSVYRVRRPSGEVVGTGTALVALGRPGAWSATGMYPFE